MPIPMKVGRPCKYDLNEEAEKILAWVERDDATALVLYTAERDIPYDAIAEWARDDAEFSRVLKRVKQRIAKRQRERLHDKENPLNYGLFMREHHHYDPFLKSCEREDKEFESKLKKEEAAQVSQEHDKNFVALMTLLSNQTSSQAKIASNIDINATKSE